MKIERKKLREIAKTFLEVLDNEKAESLDDLEKLAGQAIPIEEREQDYLIIDWRHSNKGTRALSIAYVVQHKKGEVGGGVPLDVRINPVLDYSQIILKCSEYVRGYAPFAEDSFENIAQSQLMKTIDWKEVRREVAKLVEG